MSACFELSGFEVKDIVSKAEKITSGKNTTMPVLSSVYFKVRSGNLTATCFDTKSGYVYTHPQQVNCEDVGMVVPLKEFSSLVKNFNNNDTISLTKEGSKVGIKNSFADFTISLLNEEEYPEIELNEGCEENSLVLTQEEFSHYFSLSYCAAKEAAARAILSSLMVKNNNKKVSFFSTDGHCLAYGEKEFSGDEIVGSNDVCIPKIFVDFVLKFVKDTNQEKIKVMFRKDIVSVGLDNLLVFSRLIDGEPLDPDMILSQMSEFRYTTTFEKEKLIEAFKFFSNTNKDTIPVVVKANERNIVLSLQGSSISGRISVEGESVMYKTEEPIEFGINADYALNAVDHINQDEVCISLIDGISAVFFYGKNDNDRHVVMPVKI